jgi:hypothetical protein
VESPGLDVMSFAVLACKVQFVSFPKATRGLAPISYKGALLSTLLHAIVQVITKLFECTGTDDK